MSRQQNRLVGDRTRGRSGLGSQGGRPGCPRAIEADLVSEGLANVALDYAGRAWPVVPLHSWTGSGCTCGRADCSSPAKHPRTAHGLKDATTELAEVVAWWKRWPEANIGLLTGVMFDVLDIDGEEGMAAVNSAVPWNGGAWDGGPTGNDTIDGPTVITGRGHHVYVAATGQGNKAGLLPHVDWRGKGGYVVAPPSIHASGRCYEWFPGWGLDQEIAPAPAWLLELLTKPATFAPSQGTCQPQRDGSAYGRAALEQEVGRVLLSREGERNHALNRASFAVGQLIAGREIDDAYGAVEALRRAGEAVGLGHEEVVATIGSGVESGSLQPRRSQRRVS